MIVEMFRRVGFVVKIIGIVISVVVFGLYNENRNGNENGNREEDIAGKQ